MLPYHTMKDGIRKTIYIGSPKVWAEIEKEAKRLDRSVSWYLVACHREVQDLNKMRAEPIREYGVPSKPDELPPEEEPGLSHGDLGRHIEETSSITPVMVGVPITDPTPTVEGEPPVPETPVKDEPVPEPSSSPEESSPQKPTKKTSKKKPPKTKKWVNPVANTALAPKGEKDKK